MFYFKDEQQVTVYFNDGKMATWTKENIQYPKVCQMCEDQEWIKIDALHRQNELILTSDSAKVNEKGNVEITTTQGKVEFEPTENDHLLNIITLLQKKGILGTDIEPVKPFLINMLKNPFINAVHEIFEYCKNKDFEITPDGCLLAYKNVNEDLTSVYDGKTKHVIGEYTEVERFDTNRQRECSTGLHFACKSYLSNYSGKLTILVKVNPMDIVSIPKDYNHTKGRCRKYLTMGIIAKDGTLENTNLKEAIQQDVVKTPKKVVADKVKANLSGTNRLQETKENMDIHNNDVAKVAKVMNISVETVKRNLRKLRAKENA